MSTEGKINSESISDVVHYYEVRMSALSDYSNGVWNRFNWFLTLQLAIFGFYFSQSNKIGEISLFESGVPIVGVIVAILWLIMGAEDFISMNKHGKKTTKVEDRVLELLSEQNIKFNFKVKKSVIRFRQTWLLFLFPALLIASWLIVYFLLISKL